MWVSAAANTITYNCNGQTGGTAPEVATNVSNGASVILTAPNCYKTNYGFAGWNTLPDGRGTSYGPEETITAPGTMSTAGIVLYANWIASAGNMQGWTGCSSLGTGAVTALKDTRDNNVYAVAKLGDGKCWEIENLRLSSGTISASTTHAPASGFSLGSSSTSWCSSTDSTCIDKSLWYNLSATRYTYGNLYNWYAATAGRGTYSVTSGNATGDICPLGWHLPTGTSGGEINAMTTAAGGTPAAVRKFPYNFVRGGYMDSWLTNPGSVATYWASTASSNIYANYLEFNSASLYSPGTWTKVRGYAVRCIAG